MEAAADECESYAKQLSLSICKKGQCVVKHTLFLPGFLTPVILGFGIMATQCKTGFV